MKHIVAISFFLFSISIWFYLTVYLPQRDESKLKIEMAKLSLEMQNKSIHASCDAEAAAYAKEKIKRLVKLPGQDTQENKIAVEQGLYKEEDYNYYLNQCLQRNAAMQK